MKPSQVISWTAVCAALGQFFTAMANHDQPTIYASLTAILIAVLPPINTYFMHRLDSIFHRPTPNPEPAPAPAPEPAPEPTPFSTTELTSDVPPAPPASLS